ncbi:MAG: GntR family transcriptional regulator, partial [Clostridia bacterium]
MEKTSGTLYKDIAKELENKINAGIYPKGSMMMSEMEIQKTYNVSRVTARKAYKSLIEKGILRTIQGKGTFVNDVETKDWTWMRSFTSEVLATGHFPTTKMLSFKIIQANEDLAAKLKVEVHTECFYLKRVRNIDNKPVWLTKSYIPTSVCQGLTQDYFSVAGIAQSIFKVLTLNFNVKFATKEEISEAINILDQDAEALQIVTNKPVISS